MAINERKTRKERPPVSGLRDILTVKDKDPDYEYRWAKDSSGRVQWLEQRGWEVVTESHEIGQKTVDSTTRSVGKAVTRFGGGNVTLVLMRIPKEWYDADQAAKQEMVDALEASMQREANAGSIPGQNQPGYVPDGGGLQISRRR
jgi:hypothetical protein